MRKTIFILLGALVATGCGSDDTSGGGTMTANAVIPAAGFIGRHLRVQVSGDNTDWSSSTTVSFGDGVTVGAITVASPTDIFAEITIDPAAAAGMRDVTVTDGGATATLTQAFELDSPTNMTIEGTSAQGSIALFTITNHDLDNPFDATSTGDGFTSPIVFTNFVVNAPAGVTFNVQNVDAFGASGSVLFDLDATSGNISLASGAAGAVVMSPSDAVTVAPRTATALTLGTAATATPTKAFESALYEFDAAAPAANTAAQLAIAASSTSANAAPEVFVLSASGKWADELGSGATFSAVAQTAGKYYVVALDTSGSASLAYSVKVTSTTLGLLSDTEPNNTVATAQTGTMFPLLFTGAGGAATLSDASDVDYIKITVPAGKSVHVVTSPGDAFCDTVVDVLNAAGTTSLGGPSDDQDYHEDFTSDPVPTAGTYLVKIYASSVFDPAYTHYTAMITLE